MEQILLAYGLYKETATAIMMLYTNTKAMVRSYSGDWFLWNCHRSIVKKYINALSIYNLPLLPPLNLNKSNCCILTFDPAKNAIPRWCTGKRWHILMAVMRGNRVGGNWLMKWDEVKNSHGTLIDWCTGREWPVNCMTVISAWWWSNMRFQKSSRRLSGSWTII